MIVEFTVNGQPARFDGDADAPLLWVLRDEIGLTGPKFGCGIGQCGACTVHLDGMSRRSCITPMDSMTGREVTTIEGLTGTTAAAVQQAWTSLDVPQCGFCQSGQIMSAVALLEQVPQPADEDIDRGMAGNICRCATYFRIRKAIKAAARQIAAGETK